MAEGTTRRLFEGYSTNSLREAQRLLVQAHELIAAPERWTREVWARNSSGDEVEADDPSAVSWCVGGAVLHAQVQQYGTSDAVRIVVDPMTAQAVAVIRPKRVIVALELLGAFLLLVNRKLIDVEPAAAKQSRKVKPLPMQHPTLLASDINDLPQIEHPHVLLGSAAAIVAIHQELAHRRRKSRKTSERSDEA